MMQCQPFPPWGAQLETEDMSSPFLYERGLKSIDPSKAHLLLGGYFDEDTEWLHALDDVSEEGSAMDILLSMSGCDGAGSDMPPSPSVASRKHPVSTPFPPHASTSHASL